MSDDRERGDETPSYEPDMEGALKAFQREQDAFNTACWNFDERVNEWLLAKYEVRK